MGQDIALAERQAALLAAAAEVGRNVTAILDLDELLARTVDIICDEYQFYYAGVFLLDDAQEWAMLRAGRGKAGAAMVAEGHKLAVGGHSMIGTSIQEHRGLIALDVGEEPVHFKNPHLPDTRSEMALPLIVRDEVIGALTVQSEEEAAFSDEDIESLQAMANHLAVALYNARLIKALQAAHEELLRTKTYEAVADATLEAIHWIGNKALPISTGVERLRADLAKLAPEGGDLLASMNEDLDLISVSARLIVSVQEHLIGPARESMLRPALAQDVLKDVVVSMDLHQMATIEAAADLPLVWADTTQLARAFEYVLENAAEAIAGQEQPAIEIAIDLSDDGEFVTVRITDNGPGIPERLLDKIWAAFYSTKGKGHAGLGLSACLQIMQQLGGRVRAMNAPEGGAVLELSVPVFDGELPDAEMPGDKSILLVDDDDAWSQFARQALARVGNTVTVSAAVQDIQGSFDLVLVDDVLETVDTPAALAALKDAGVGGEVLVVASRLRVERSLALLHAGAQDVLVKPYTLDMLADLVQG